MIQHIHDRPPTIQRLWIAVLFTVGLISGCGDDELEPLSEEQMCDEVRGLISFRALGCTSDEATANSFGDQIYDRFVCPADMRQLLAPCLKKINGLGCGVMASLVTDPAYLHWADACLMLKNPQDTTITCATAAVAFADGVSSYLSNFLAVVPVEERDHLSAAIAGYEDVLARYRSFWWPCAETLPVASADACIQEQRGVPQALPANVTSAAALVTSAFSRSPGIVSCVPLFPVVSPPTSPINRVFTDTQLIYDLIAATLPLTDLPYSGQANGQALQSWFTQTYKALSVEDASGDVVDQQVASCLQGLTEILSQPSNTASVDIFTTAFQRTSCHTNLLAPR
jgi:hypothetical protein